MGNNFAEVHIGKNQLKIHLRPMDFVDPKGMVDKIPDGYNWTMDRRVYLKAAVDLDYVVGLIFEKQRYKSGNDKNAIWYQRHPPDVCREGKERNHLVPGPSPGRNHSRKLLAPYPRYTGMNVYL
jgi:hypothetical protein